MRFLKHLPIGYTGRLRDIRLINFAVEADELRYRVPGLPVVEIGSRPIISMLDVKLYGLRPTVAFNPFQFTYRHVAFRVLVKDDHLHPDKISRGFYYLNSFSDNSRVARFGRLFTDFNFERAEIHEEGDTFSLRRGDRYIKYVLDPNAESEEHPDLKLALMKIDRAYSMTDDRLKVTRVRRTGLPLTPIRCNIFDTNYFTETEFLAAYCVNEVLDYQWLPARTCEPLFASI
jgi:hypothetical protein